MESDDADVLLPGGLLRLDEARRPVQADEEAAGDLRVQGAGMPRLLALQDALNPRDNLPGAARHAVHLLSA